MPENRRRSGDCFLTRSGFLIVLAAVLAMSDWCYAVDASSACEEESGIRVGVDVIALTSESVSFRFSLKNVSAEKIQVSQDLIPWFDAARVSIVLLDWRSGGSCQKWVAASSINFSPGENRIGQGRGWTRVIREFITSVDPVLSPGATLATAVMFSESPSGFSLTESDLDRLRRESVFLWVVRVNAGPGECLQSGITRLK